MNGAFGLVHKRVRSDLQTPQVQQTVDLELPDVPEGVVSDRQLLQTAQSRQIQMHKIGGISAEVSHGEKRDRGVQGLESLLREGNHVEQLVVDR